MGPAPATGRMTHSLSTPSGVDGTASTASRSGKKLAIRVQMLDDSVTLFQVQVSRFIHSFIFFSIYIRQEEKCKRVREYIA